MNKIKNLKKMFFSIIVMFLCILNVNAEEIYYTNLNGVELTENQYNNLLKGFSEDTIATLSQDIIDVYKDDENLQTTQEIKYIRTDEYYYNGNLIDVIDTEITEEEALSGEVSMTPFIPQAGINAWNVTHQTAMKKLTMTITTPSWASTRAVTITNTWLSIPNVKSFDVIAIRPSGSVQFNSSGSNSGYQKYDGNIITYSNGGTNMKKITGLNGGIGISMNIVDSTSVSLECSLTSNFIFSSNPFQVWGTYQHATSSLSLDDSKSYTFSNAGLGNVLYYSNSVIRNKYDGMQGVYLSYNYGDEWLS